LLVCRGNDRLWARNALVFAIEREPPPLDGARCGTGELLE